MSTAFAAGSVVIVLTGAVRDEGVSDHCVAPDAAVDGPADLTEALTNARSRSDIRRSVRIPGGHVR